MTVSSESANQGHRGRLREKFMSAGLEGFHDYEVVELLLTLATPRKDCKSAAKAALKRFKTLPAVMEASTAELCEIDGIGPKNCFGIKLVKAVADRYRYQRLVRGDSLHHSREVFDYLCLTLRDRSRESFVMICLDAKNRVTAAETLFEGTLTASSVYPREVIRAALGHRAAAVIFAHNHPSGEPAPSKEDMLLTRQLLFACRMVGITMHEHLIVGHNRYYSFADEGHVARLQREYETFIQRTPND